MAVLNVRPCHICNEMQRRYQSTMLAGILGPRGLRPVSAAVAFCLTCSKPCIQQPLQCYSMFNMS